MLFFGGKKCARANFYTFRMSVFPPGVKSASKRASIFKDDGSQPCDYDLLYKIMLIVNLYRKGRADAMDLELVGGL